MALHNIFISVVLDNIFISVGVLSCYGFNYLLWKWTCAEEKLVILVYFKVVMLP